MDPNVELLKRITATIATWKKLENVWKRAGCQVNIRVYDAAIRATLRYGIESVQVTESTEATLDVFHLKGLRQIFKHAATYVNRSNTNWRVYEAAERKPTKEKTTQHTHAFRS